MKLKTIRRAAAALAVCGMVTATGMVVLANSSHNTGTGWAGSTRVVAEVGYNGTRAYASVSADNYVDARMNGWAKIIPAGGNQPLVGAFDQRSYGEVAREFPGQVYLVHCEFSVIGEDGDWNWTGSVGSVASQ